MGTVKIIVAPDSFKGNMGSPAVCAALSAGIRDVAPSALVVETPLADGGEGTARAITRAAGGVFKTLRVTGPLGDPVEAEFGLIRDGATAVLDMASASGIELLPRDELDPMRATSYGAGELIRAALDEGVGELLVGIGGSATSEGGVGLAQALGFGILDACGKQVARGGAGLAGIAEVRVAAADPRLARARFRVACDVTNPLLGPRGAAAVFGPQKGATPEMVRLLDEGLGKLAAAYIGAGLADDVDHPGDGAAGGLGATLRILLHAEIASGARTVMEYAGFFDALRGADLVITGEGMTDAQTAGGKLCSVVAAACREAGVPVALVSGALGGEVAMILETFDYAVSASCGQVGLERMIEDSPRDLRFAAANLMRAYELGRSSRPT